MAVVERREPGKQGWYHLDSWLVLEEAQRRARAYELDHAGECRVRDGEGRVVEHWAPRA